VLKKYIKLNTDDLKEFTEIVSQIDCDIDLNKGSYSIDAKSIMGIFTLDLSKPVKLVIYSEDENLLNKFKKWFV